MEAVPDIFLRFEEFQDASDYLVSGYHDSIIDIKIYLRCTLMMGVLLSNVYLEAHQQILQSYQE